MKSLARPLPLPLGLLLVSDGFLGGPAAGTPPGSDDFPAPCLLGLLYVRQLVLRRSEEEEVWDWSNDGSTGMSQSLPKSSLSPGLCGRGGEGTFCCSLVRPAARPRPDAPLRPSAYPLVALTLEAHCVEGGLRGAWLCEGEGRPMMASQAS